MAEAARTLAERRRFLEAAAGTKSESFGLAEWGLLAAIAAIWGSSFVLIEIGLRSFAPGVIVTARIGLGAATLALVPAARRPIPREDLARVALLGIIWIAIPLTLFPFAQRHIDSSVAGMLNGAMPLFAAAWSALLLRRAPGRFQIAGLIVGFAGTLAISWPELGGSQATLQGTVMVLIAISMYGLSANLAVPLQQRHGALPVLLRAQLAALVFVAPLGIAGIGSSEWSWESAAAMVPLGMLGTGLAFVLMATLVGRMGGPRGAVAIYFVPVVAMILGVALLDETIAPIALIGAALVVVGAWLTSRREPQRRD